MLLTLHEIRHLQQQGRIEEALNQCQQAHISEPHQLNLLAMLGTLRVQNQEIDQARKILSQLESLGVA